MMINSNGYNNWQVNRYDYIVFRYVAYAILKLTDSYQMTYYYTEYMTVHVS